MANRVREAVTKSVAEFFQVRAAEVDDNLELSIPEWFEVCTGICIKLGRSVNMTSAGPLSVGEVIRRLGGG